MSMTMLTLLQLTEIFTVYTVMTVCLPAVIFHKKVSGQRLTVRFMIYTTIGNFYIINLVFLLQLLHISNRYTLGFLTLIPAIVAAIMINHIPIWEIILNKCKYINKLFLRRMGLRTFLREVFHGIGKGLYKIISWIGGLLHSHILEWLLFIGLFLYVFWVYGTNSLHTFGYCSSDMPLHNKWINAMGDNQIFIDGVYPFGLHCSIYYLHTIFGIDTYVLLRLFCLVQTAYLHLILFAFIKACCKTRFAAYIGVGIYVIISIFQEDCTNRFYSVLPQEFGMMFILPSIYFALCFFAEKKKEIGTGWIAYSRRARLREAKVNLRSLNFKERSKLRWKSISLSTWYLVGFVMSFSLIMTGHFYGTIIAGIFCVAIALAFGRRFFSRNYFGPVIAAFFLGIMIALLPMVISFATGTPLQGSFGWGMKVINGESQEPEEEQNEIQTEVPTGEQSTENQLTEQITGDTANEISISEDTIITLDDWVIEKYQAISKQVIKYSKLSYASIDETVNRDLVEKGNQNFFAISLICIGWLFFFAIISLLQKRFDYGATLIASLIYLCFLFFLLGSGRMGLKELMDSNRCRIYLAYSMPILFSFVVDAPVYVIFGAFRKKWVMYLASLCFCCIVGTGIYLYKPIRTPNLIEGLETNQAVTCLTNIIRDNEDMNWTIVSANDELQMGDDHGRHYETIQFLNDMEYTGFKGVVLIPTQYVYFFIEKKPIDYTVEYDKSGQSISKEGAKRSLPEGDTDQIAMYKGENRWIVMSRMYYWAQMYQKLYSNEMKVYYEDDDFVCYRIEQNEYSLNNFAIDYEYNLPENKAE